MRYLLDTDTFSALAKGSSAEAASRFESTAPGAGHVSVITLGEVAYGIALRPVSQRLRQEIELLQNALVALPLGPGVLPHYAALRVALRKAGTPIGPNDCWIAAHAMAEGLTLVTNNEREFKRVKGLKVENWLR